MQNDLKQLIIDQANSAASSLPPDAALKDRLAVLRLLVQADEQISGRAVTYAHKRAGATASADADESSPGILTLDTDEAP
jgi:hypothetical protein